MSRIDEIRNDLKLPSRAQVAWSMLTKSERKVFVSLAGLASYKRQYLEPEFDSFPTYIKSNISRAILYSCSIADKFNAHLSPSMVRETKKLDSNLPNSLLRQAS